MPECQVACFIGSSPGMCRARPCSIEGVVAFRDVNPQAPPISCSSPPRTTSKDMTALFAEHGPLVVEIFEAAQELAGARGSPGGRVPGRSERRPGRGAGSGSDH